jgi:UDP-N-acetylmuramyl pentapeptide phosphotransferase/UDP-N-acetylglucosamine-1-phosphate transferase
MASPRWRAHSWPEATDVFAAVVLAVLVALASWAGVAMVRRYALRRLLDRPNERSSHTQPTPRGGGLGLTVAHLLGMTAASMLGLHSLRLAAALAGGGLVVAVIGFLDDHRPVSPALRLGLHILAFVWAAAWLGWPGGIDFGWGAIPLGWIGRAMLVLCLAWFLNLFNFMDGIDGIAGLQALFMAAVGAALAYMATDGDWTSTTPLVLLGAATAGFLAWNWPPARIFMGDVGSGYLGFALGVLALWTMAQGWLTVWVWLILGGTFIADATVTLLVRARARLRVVEAHRSHAYQRLSRYWNGHRPVTLAFAVVNFAWLAPWAYCAMRWPDSGFLYAILAVGPLFVLAVLLGAGRTDELGRAAPTRT